MHFIDFFKVVFQGYAFIDRTAGGVTGKGGERGDDMQQTLAGGGIKPLAAAKDSAFLYMGCALYQMSYKASLFYCFLRYILSSVKPFETYFYLNKIFCFRKMLLAPLLLTSCKVKSLPRSSKHLRPTNALIQPVH